MVFCILVSGVTYQPFCYKLLLTETGEYQEVWDGGAQDYFKYDSIKEAYYLHFFSLVLGGVRPLCSLSYLELIVQPRLTSNLWHSFFQSLSAGIIAWLSLLIFRVESRERLHECSCAVQYSALT